MPMDSSPESPPASPAAEPSDFRRLREVGERAGLSRVIGAGFCRARNAVARGLLALGVVPNMITVAGCLVTIAAGYCLAHGAGDQVPYFYDGHGPRSWWPVWAAAFMILSGACDMLDGAVARIGNLYSRFGGILDSVLDRVSDMALFIGCGLCFVQRGNLTLLVLALIALCDATLISYIKARAENTIANCTVGYWMRGERVAAILIGCLSGHVVAVIWQLAILSACTAWVRLDYARRAAAALDAGREPPSTDPPSGWRAWLLPWRHPRGSVAYDIVTGTNIAFIIFGPRLWDVFAAHGEWADPLARWFGN